MSNPKVTAKTYFKVLDKNAKGTHSGFTKYPLPTFNKRTKIWTPGEFTPVREVNPCTSGWHILTLEQLISGQWFKPVMGHRLFIARMANDCDRIHQRDKVVVSSMQLQAEVLGLEGALKPKVIAEQRKKALEGLRKEVEALQKKAAALKLPDDPTTAQLTNLRRSVDDVGGHVAGVEDGTYYVDDASRADWWREVTTTTFIKVCKELGF